MIGGSVLLGLTTSLTILTVPFIVLTIGLDNKSVLPTTVCTTPELEFTKLLVVLDTLLVKFVTALSPWLAVLTAGFKLDQKPLAVPDMVSQTCLTLWC